MITDIHDLNSLIPNLSPELETSFQEFFTLLERYNSKINLVSNNSMPRVGVKHFADCYLGLKIFEKDLQTEFPIFDFGAGNGFPGIIAALMFKNQRILMVERDKRKAEFLKIASDQLGLKNVEVHAGNVSDLADGSCHKVVSRAMAPLPKFLLETRAVVPPGGDVYLFKGDHWSIEFGAIPAQVFEFWEVDVMGSYDLPNDEGSRFIIHCKRISP